MEGMIAAGGWGHNRGAKGAKMAVNSVQMLFS